MLELFAEGANVASLSMFDKGVAIAVIIILFGFMGVMVKRWLKAMDALDKREEKHLSEMRTMTKDHHKELLEIHKEYAKDRAEHATLLHNIAKSMETIGRAMSDKQL